MKTFTDAEVRHLLLTLPDWRFAGGQIQREWTFADFPGAILFVNQVAAAAERASHHPDIDIRYNRVRLALSTHDAEGITERDMKLARELSALVPR